MKLISTEIRTTPQHVQLVGKVARNSEQQAFVPWAIDESYFHRSVQGEQVAEVLFEFPRRYESFVSPVADAFAIALLVPSMAAGEPLEIVPPISESLLFELTGIRDVFHTWYPEKFHRVPVQASARLDPLRSRAPRAATFFSGGVDSFYTMLKRRDHEPLPAPLTHIIFMHGMEQSLEDSKDTDPSQRRAEKIAAAAGLQCVTGTHNLRSVFPLHWERYYFGSALAATAVALSGGFGYVCIPSSFSYGHQVPHGSTPLLDDRYSTEAVRIVHDGGEATRAVKTARILEWDAPLVLENLRVCLHNQGGDFNCGRCYKCVRTAVALKAVGAWQDAVTFPDKSTSHWDKMVLEDHPVLTEENLELARQRGVDADLIRRLERIVRKVNRYDGLAAYAKNSALEHLLPIFRRARSVAGGGPRMH